MNTQWIIDLPYYSQIPIAHRKFLTRFNSYREFERAYYKLCEDCLFFCVDIPKTERGKASPLGVIELMFEFEKVERECG